ncbi:hypothetical protein BJX61DRAFT_519873 [Aspergillus egyptiacus]|nr:hypothetical protein BJX61DRAFT_519873 [Aspergillus egyptiacus]
MMSRWHFKSSRSEEAELQSRDFAKNADAYKLPHPIGEAMVLAEAEQRDNEEKRVRELIKREDSKDIEAAAIRELEIVAEEMQTAWDELKQAIPQGHLRSGDSGDPVDTNKPGILDVVSYLSVSKKDEEKTSLVHRIKQSCGDVCQTLDNYSELFKFVPTGDRFVSLVVGTMTTIVEATVRHRKIGAGFADAVDKIRAALLDTTRILEICQTADTTDAARLQAKVAGVLVVVLRFLIPYTRWCRSRFDRFKNSLNRNYYEEHVAGALAGLDAGLTQLHREQTVHMHKKLNLYVERDWKMNQRRRKYEDGEEDVEEKRWSELKQALREIGENGINLNKVTAEKEALNTEKRRFEQYRQEKLAEIRKGKAAHLWQWSVREAASRRASASVPEGTVVEQLWQEIESASSHLEAVADNGYPIELLPGTGDVRASQPVFERLHDWIAKDTSQWLWLCSYGNSEPLSEVSIAAFYVFMLCRRLQLPLLAYRLQADDMGLPESPTAAATPRSLGLDRFTLLVYSLIRQLVWLLPEKFQAQAQQFSQERFLRLDGSTATLLDALNLLEELLALLPEPLVCIVDGFQFIDNDLSVDGTSGYIDIFLDTFRQAGWSKKIKVLVCSDGYCRSLLDEENIEVTEQMIVYADDEVGDRGVDYFDLSDGI